MLPYRLRPPVGGSQQKQISQAEPLKNNDPYEEGGPVQEALHQDFLELRAVFLDQLNQRRARVTDETLTNRTKSPSLQEMKLTPHEAAGTIFSIFKQVFGDARLALIHTRTLPPRCDASKYTQLIYASCWDLLLQSFEDSDSLLGNFTRASYAVFLLYTLHQTHPQRQQPNHQVNKLDMLPLGLKDPSNPKLLYRRTFGERIRIDRHHYSLLQQLRDVALAQQAQCQEHRMKLWKQEMVQRNKATDSSEAYQSGQWICSCGLATDTITVIDMLWPCFDYGEYTGPSGLEALAGHKDYPYRCERPPKQGVATTGVHTKGVLTEEEIQQREVQSQTIRKDNSLGLPTLATRLEAYRHQVESLPMADVNLPNQKKISHQVNRVRNALAPVVQSSSRTAWKERIHRLDEGNGYIVVSTHDETVAVSGELDSGDDGMENLPLQVDPASLITNGMEHTNQVETATEENNGNEPGTTTEAACQFVLPSDLPESVKRGLQSCLNVMLERGDLARLGSKHLEEGETSMIDGGEVASVLSDALSSRSPGRAALRALLSGVQNQVSSGQKRPYLSEKRNHRPTDIIRPPKKSATDVLRGSGGSFLALDFDSFDDKADEKKKRQLSDDSDLSSISSDDEGGFPMAASMVGQNALRTLLSSVQQDDAIDDGSVTRTRRQTKRRGRASTTNTRRAKSPKEPRKAPGTQSGSKRATSSSDSESSELSDLDAAAAPGKEALLALLSKASLPS